MLKQRFRITSKDVDYWFLGTRQDAFRDFFNQIKDGRIPLEKVGNLVMARGERETENEQVPMRVLPALLHYWMKLVSDDVAEATLSALGIKIERNQLLEMALKDSWVWM